MRARQLTIALFVLRACALPEIRQTDVVRRIYGWFVDDSLIEAEIASELNALGYSNQMGRAWTRGTVHEILTNEKYIGNNVYNRVSFKLKRLRVTNTPEMWIRKDDAFEAIVPRDTFFTAQGIMRARARRFTHEELVERLKRLYEQRGFLSSHVINEAEEMPSSSVYALRFGSLLKAYQLVGYVPNRDYRYLEINRYLRRLHPQVVSKVESQVNESAGHLFRDVATDLLDVNHEFRVSIALARCQQAHGGRRYWKVRFDAGLRPDITIAVRMSPSNESVMDYYLLPRLWLSSTAIRIAEHNPIELESFRFDSLRYFYGMASRVHLRRTI